MWWMAASTREVRPASSLIIKFGLLHPVSPGGCCTQQSRDLTNLNNVNASDSWARNNLHQLVLPSIKAMTGMRRSLVSHLGST